MRRILLAPLAAFALAACTTATAPLPQQTVEPGYAIGGGSFSTGTRVIVAADAFREAGKVAVCAAWATDGRTAREKPYLDDVLGIGVLQLGGRNVLQGFGGFPRAASRAALGNAPAGCVRTGHDWQPEYAGLEPRIRFGRIVLERDDEDLGAGTINFRGD